MSDVEQIVKDLAAITAAEQLLAEAKKERKDALQEQLSRGTVFASTSTGDELGYASIPKPARPKPHIVVTDEAQMLAWMVDEFGEDIVETRVQLTEQGRKSFDQFVLDAHKAAGSEDYFDLPGVSVTVPPTKASVPRFVPAKNVVELVQGMAQRGEFSFTSLLEIGERP